MNINQIIKRIERLEQRENVSRFQVFWQFENEPPPEIPPGTRGIVFHFTDELPDQPE